MATSAEQLYHGKLVTEPVPEGKRHLYLDLDICGSNGGGDCAVQCDYFHHVGNNGVRSLVELATYALVCRHCEEPHCVAACPHDALEQLRDHGNLLVRHQARCVSCRSCSLACPYGTIYPEYVPQLTHNCDFCLDRRNGNSKPLCVETCSAGALRLVEAGAVDGDHTFRAGMNLVVHSTHWERGKA